MDKMDNLTHPERDKVVFEFFSNIVTESNIVFLKADNNVDRIPLRIQMIISFTLMDVLASYWYEYLGKVATISTRSCSWYDTFCKTERNTEYNRDKQLKILSSERLYQFRNSLVHFMGMSEIKENLYMSLASNDLPENEKELLIKGLETKGHRTVVIRPNDFHKLIKQGGILMLNEMQKVIEQSHTDNEKKKEHIEGIERIFNKIQLEGAVGIYRPK